MVVKFNQNFEKPSRFQVMRQRGHSQQRDKNVQGLTIVKQYEVLGELLKSKLFI